MKKLILSTALVMIAGTGLTGCMATMTALNHANCDFNNGCSSIVSTVIASEDYIAIGRPATPIAGYDRPLILAGKKSSIIVDMPTEDKNLLEQIMQEKHLLPHLNISLSSGNGDARTFYIKEGEKEVKGYAGLYFVKPVHLFTDKERIALEQLGFERGENESVYTCYDDGYGTNSNGCGVERVYYRKDFVVKMGVAGAVNNINQLTHTLKRPVNITIRQQRHSKKADIAGALILPAMAIDIVTLPVQVVGGAILGVGAKVLGIGKN